MKQEKLVLNESGRVKLPLKDYVADASCVSPTS